MLRCPSCNGQLLLEPLEQRTVVIASHFQELAQKLRLLDERFSQQVESGLLLCKACRIMYPIFDGLPLLLRYTTPLHRRFAERHGGKMLARFASYRFANEEAEAGERAVMASFSREWLDYDYDGVIWEMSYDDHERRFLTEIGPALKPGTTRTFLEVGCGLGITSALAQKNGHTDAVGLDLSLAVWKANRHYQDNPFLHFVQASVFAMPFSAATFDVVYSRGVLHHTVSTQKAFEAVAPLCRSGGTVYLWVYGTGSITETWFRRLAYGLECVFRPLLSRAPESIPAKAFLAAMGAGYMIFNSGRRLFDPSIQPLTLARGIHAARDRFTPRYAHRHEVSEVVDWFRRAGFDRTEIVDWRAMPSADHDDFRRNVGIRGTLSGAASG